MPKKSRRVAARQAELGQRKRKAHRPSSQTDAHSREEQLRAAQPANANLKPALREAQSPGARDDIEEIARPEVAGPAPRMASQQVQAGRGQRNAPSPRAGPRTVNPYIWPEIKRIGMLTGLVLVILAVLTVFLR